MPITTGQRERLDDLMNRRRLELGITWRDVASRAGVSYEVLRKLRTGDGGIRDLTASKISRALEWEGPSVGEIIDGGEPVAMRRDGERPDDMPTPQCELELRVLRSDILSDDQKRRFVRAHRAEEPGHRWCRFPDEHTGTPEASAGVTLPEGARAAAG